MKATVIDLKDIESIGINFGELIKEQLIENRIDMRELQEERLSGCWLDGSIEPKGLKEPLPWSNWFDTTSGD